MSATIAGSLTSRQRLQATLNHQQPDRVCVDFGATAVTGIHVSAVMRLRQAVLGQPDFRVKVIEPYQMLGEVENELRTALGIDVIGIPGRKSLFGTVSDNWKPFTMNDGTPVLVSGDFNVTKDEAGDTYIYPEGEMSVPPSGRMPAGGYFFDAVIRQDPIDEEKLNPEDNLEEFGLLSEEDLAYYRSMRQWLLEHPDCGAMLVVPGAAFGDIALVPATFLKHPKGIRDVEEWYISTVTRKDYVRTVFERQCEIAEQNIAMSEIEAAMMARLNKAASGQLGNLMAGAGLAFPGVTVPQPEARQNSIFGKLDALKNRFTSKDETNRNEPPTRLQDMCQGADHMWIHAGDKEPNADSLCECGKVRWSERNLQPVPILNVPQQVIVKGNGHQPQDPH